MKETIILKNDLAELDKLHSFVEKLGNKMLLPKKCMIDANLALEEVFANIVTHGFHGRKVHSIKISIACPANGTLLLRVEDKGRPFNPLKAAEPQPVDDLEKCSIGGLGIHLVKKIMDDVSYDHRGHKNVLEMKKSIN
jgi:anti-sigma regulatory factor (Ser/Thr protein kinase)